MEPGSRWLTFATTLSASLLAAIALVLAGLDLGAAVEATAAESPTPTRWRDAGLAIARGDLPAAAEIFGHMRARPFEAQTIVLAARHGFGAELSTAIEFFRETGGSAYLGEAEALLARSRSA